MRQWHSMPSRSITVCTWASESAASARLSRLIFFPSLGTSLHPLAREAFAEGRAAADAAAVAGRGADAEFAALQHRHLDTRARQLERRREAAIRRAPHQ